MIIFNNIIDVDIPKIKRKGAKWNEQLQKWYSNDNWETDVFREWIAFNEYSKMIIKKQIYLLEIKFVCYNCQEEVTIIVLGYKNFEMIDNFGNLMIGNKDIRFSTEIPIEQLHEKILDYLSKEYKYYKSYSKYVDDSYYSNHCKYCGAKIGDYYIPNIVRNEIQYYKNNEIQYNVYEIKLQGDIVCENIQEYFNDENTNNLIKIKELNI